MDSDAGLFIQLRDSVLAVLRERDSLDPGLAHEVIELLFDLGGDQLKMMTPRWRFDPNQKLAVIVPHRL